MITLDSIEQAYCFFHQKWNIYSRSSLDWQRDDIEYAISQYAESMNKALYEEIAAGRHGFLHDHATFAHDLQEAVEQLGKKMPLR